MRDAERPSVLAHELLSRGPYKSDGREPIEREPAAILPRCISSKPSLSLLWGLRLARFAGRVKETADLVQQT